MEPERNMRYSYNHFSSNIKDKKLLWAIFNNLHNALVQIIEGLQSLGLNRQEIVAIVFKRLLLSTINIYFLIEVSNYMIGAISITGLLIALIASFGLLANFIPLLVIVINKEKYSNIKQTKLYSACCGLSKVTVIAGVLLVCLFDIICFDPLIIVLAGICIYYLFLVRWF